jgi:plasmid stabilization system protein ParE
MRLRITPPAALEIEDNLLGMARESPQAASRLTNRIDAVMVHLREFPLAGPNTSEPGIRRVNLLPYPYAVLYEIFQDEVVVHAVRHGARHPHELKVFSR